MVFRGILKAAHTVQSRGASNPRPYSHTVQSSLSQPSGTHCAKQPSTMPAHMCQVGTCVVYCLASSIPPPSSKPTVSATPRVTLHTAQAARSISQPSSSLCANRHTLCQAVADPTTFGTCAAYKGAFHSLPAHSVPAARAAPLIHLWRAALHSC
jgi:hypothetical protein